MSLTEWFAKSATTPDEQWALITEGEQAIRAGEPVTELEGCEVFLRLAALHRLRAEQPGIAPADAENHHGWCRMLAQHAADQAADASLATKLHVFPRSMFLLGEGDIDSLSAAMGSYLATIEEGLVLLVVGEALAAAAAQIEGGEAATVATEARQLVEDAQLAFQRAGEHRLAGRAGRATRPT